MPFTCRALKSHLLTRCISANAVLVSAQEAVDSCNRRCALSRPCENVLAIFLWRFQTNIYACPLTACSRPGALAINPLAIID